ncbi:DUF4870 domain-containing protein [Salmonirosea aquatica]|uniref:DUF4870 domain-containing protein n=1 Tax=Salmonirosea aquatica TaxID=2654236 RepID=A0A7C9BA47_9BACT|nr:DUF4870 domain-containing protein [Cytophagaceae bacterium SJW1-29]
MEDQNFTPSYPSEITAGQRSAGMWMHLGALLASFANMLVPIPFLALIVILVLYNTQKGKSSFVDEHGKESLNFQITLAVVGVVILLFMLFAFGSSILSLIIGGVSDNETSTDVGIMGMVGSGLVVGLVFFAIGIFSLVVMITGSVRANGGKAYRYPLSLRLVK